MPEVRKDDNVNVIIEENQKEDVLSTDESNESNASNASDEEVREVANNKVDTDDKEDEEDEDAEDAEEEDDEDDESIEADGLTDVGLYNVLGNFLVDDNGNTVGASFASIALELKRLNSYIKRLVPEKTSK